MAGFGRLTVLLLVVALTGCGSQNVQSVVQSEAQQVTIVFNSPSQDARVVGTSISVSVRARSTSPVHSLQLLMDGHALASANGPQLQGTFPAAVGKHSLEAIATDSLQGRGFGFQDFSIVQKPAHLYTVTYRSSPEDIPLCGSFDEIPTSITAFNLGTGLTQLPYAFNPPFPDSRVERYDFIPPQGKFLYTVGFNCNRNLTDSSHERIFSYAIQADGTLTEISESEVVGFTFAAPISDPDGKFVFITSNDGLHEYAIDQSTGLLTEMSGSPFSVGGVQGANGEAITPDGELLFVGGGSNLPGGSTIWAFRVNASTGALAPLPGPVASSTFSGLRLEIAPRGDLLFLFHQDPPHPVSASMFRIDQLSGALSSLDELPLALDADAIAFNASGNLAYEDGGIISPNIALLSVMDFDDKSATFTKVAGSPLVFDAGPWVDLNEVSGIRPDPTGQYLYVTTNQDLLVVALNADGTPQLPPVFAIRGLGDHWAFLGGLVIAP